MPTQTVRGPPHLQAGVDAAKPAVVAMRVRRSPAQHSGSSSSSGRRHSSDRRPLAKRGRKRTMSWEERRARFDERNRASMRWLRQKAAGILPTAAPKTVDPSVAAAPPSSSLPGAPQMPPSATADAPAAAAAAAEAADIAKAKAKVQAYRDGSKRLNALVRESSHVSVAPRFLDAAEQRMFGRLRDGAAEYARASRLLRAYKGASAEERAAKAPLELARQWRRGRLASRWLYVLGREVARRRKLLGGATPESAWVRLLGEWSVIEANWERLGWDEGREDEVEHGAGGAQLRGNGYVGGM